MKSVILSKNLDFILIKFPFIFPLIYFLVLSLIPSVENLLIFFTLLFLAEAHFGATWPFFINKNNISHIKKNYIKLLVFPILIIILSTLGLFMFHNLFLIFFFGCNIYHVSRQSIGINKLFIRDKNTLNISENIIYFFNLSFFIIGLFIFSSSKIDNVILNNINEIILFLLLILLSFLVIKKFNSDEIFLTLTGSLMFYPVCFVDKPIHAIIMGVTMHYVQYLSLVSKVQIFRFQFKSNQILIFIFIIFLYSFIMTIFSVSGKSTDNIISKLFYIPIIFQMLHFYIDSQIWKFSVKHNRDNVLNYLIK
jgi:hypothetical protein